MDTYAKWGRLRESSWKRHLTCSRAACSAHRTLNKPTSPFFSRAVSSAHSDRSSPLSRSKLEYAGLGAELISQFVMRIGLHRARQLSHVSVSMNGHAIAIAGCAHGRSSAGVLVIRTSSISDEATFRKMVWPTTVLNRPLRPVSCPC